MPVGQRVNFKIIIILFHKLIILVKSNNPSIGLPEKKIFLINIKRKKYKHVFFRINLIGF